MLGMGALKTRKKPQRTNSECMDRGYVKLYRKSIDSQVFANMGLWQVWCWCLMKASHKEKWVPIKTGRGETEVLLQPGQFIFGRKSASKKLKMKPSTIQDRMRKLQNMQNLVIQPVTHYSIITILNWDIYNTQENKSDTDPVTHPTTIRQPSDTKKNNKNNKKIKEIYKEKFGEFKNVLLTQDELKKLILKINNDKTQQMIERLSGYLESSGKRYKSHYATILNWIRKDEDVGKVKPTTYAQAQDLERRERAKWLLGEMEDEKNNQGTDEVIPLLPSD